jgi:hypothetical protein
VHTLTELTAGQNLGSEKKTDITLKRPRIDGGRPSKYVEYEEK